MLRNVLGVIAGYLVMFVLIALSFTGAYLAMGADRAFKPATFEPSTLWIGISIVLGTAAAILGGVVCALIAKRKGAVVALVVVVLVLGLVQVVFMLVAPATTPEVRTGDVSNLDAMMKAAQPLWVTVMNPVLGAVGVMIGGRLVLKKA